MSVWEVYKMLERKNDVLDNNITDKVQYRGMAEPVESQETEVTNDVWIGPLRGFIESRRQALAEFAKKDPAHPEIQMVQNMIDLAKAELAKRTQPGGSVEPKSKEVIERPFTVDHFDHYVQQVTDLDAATELYTKELGGEVVIEKTHEGVPYERSVQFGETRATFTTVPDEHEDYAVNADNIDVVERYFRKSGYPILETGAEHTSPTFRTLSPNGKVMEIRLAGVNAAKAYAERQAHLGTPKS